MAPVYAGWWEQGQDFNVKGVPNSDIREIEITIERKDEYYIPRVNMLVLGVPARYPTQDSQPLTCPENSRVISLYMAEYVLKLVRP